MRGHFGYSHSRTHLVEEQMKFQICSEFPFEVSGGKRSKDAIRCASTLTYIGENECKEKCGTSKLEVLQLSSKRKIPDLWLRPDYLSAGWSAPITTSVRTQIHVWGMGGLSLHGGSTAGMKRP